MGVEKVENIALNSSLELNPFWVSGFTAGGFTVGFRTKGNSSGVFYFRFHIAQHSRDVVLMNKLIQFFNCGKVSLRLQYSRCDFYVQDSNKIVNNIIPHFDNYPLQNIKHLDFTDFKKAVELHKSEGLTNGEAIKDIINNMNSKRVY